ncbi:MAG: hypothetical protein L0Y71_21930 [Gemmataceae bacterium]|nr:hypothetical protein [Gemmataceae bacterium]
MLAAVPERPKIADAPLSVVLLAPAAGDRQAVVRDWLAWLEQRAGDAELLLILDGGRGDEIQSHPRLRIVHHVEPPGIGPSLQTAVWLVRFPLMLTAPCDRQFRPADVQGLFALIDQVDFVAGCRVAAPPPAWLHVLGLVKRIVTRIVLGYADEPRVSWLGWRGFWRRFRARHIFGVKLQDSGCPLRLYRSEALRQFPIQSRGTFAWVEVAAKANDLGCWMAEAAIPWTPPNEPPIEPDDPHWRADARLVRRAPDFGSPDFEPRS